MRATHLLIPGRIEPDDGDVLARMGKTLWLREYDA